MKMLYAAEYAIPTNSRDKTTSNAVYCSLLHFILNNLGKEVSDNK